MKKEAFTYHVYEPGYATQVTELFNAVFRKKVTAEYIRKKYDTFYCPLSPVATIAFLNREPVAFYGALPLIIKKANEDFFAAHACDSITLEKHRGKGLHRQLALLSYEEMKKQNIKFVFAMHSDATLKATQSLGWKTGSPLSRFHLKTNASSAKQFFRIKNHRLPVTAEKNFTNPQVHENHMHIHYSENYIAYKSFSGNFFIKIAGCTLWTKPNRDLWIGSMNNFAKKNYRQVIEELKETAKENGFREIIFQVSKNTGQHRLLSQVLTPVDSFPYGYFCFDSSVDPTELKLNFSDLDSF